MEIDYAVYSLSDEFYEKYPNPPYKELLKKKERRYACLLIQSHYGYFICIPYRTEISHKYAYHFRKSSRSQKHRSGLDYTKIAIIKDIRNYSAVYYPARCFGMNMPKSRDIQVKIPPGRIALRRRGIMSLKRPVAGGESCKQDSFLWI